MSDTAYNESPPPTFDRPLFLSAIALVGFGIVMVYSASAIESFRTFGNAHHFVIRQVIYSFLGIGALAVGTVVDYRKYTKVVYLLLVIVILGLITCLSPLGATINGASRWIRVGPITVQPGELAKLALVLWLSYSLAKKKEKIKTFSIGFLPHILIPGFLIMLCLFQPDFGTAVLIAAVTFVLLFVAGAKLGYILLALFAATPIAYLLVSFSEYRMKRWLSFLDPFAYRDTVGYQLIQSWYGFGTGSVTGVGLGDGRGKVYLPEAHNDFIAAVVGEELGMIGVWVLLAVFSLLVYRGIRIAIKSNDEFAIYVSSGISVLLGIQVLANMGVAMGLLPTKGLNLPLVSYGGSALLVTLFSVGILLNISKMGRIESSEAGTAQGNVKRQGRVAKGEKHDGS